MLLLEPLTRALRREEGFASSPSLMTCNLLGRWVFCLGALIDTSDIMLERVRRKYETWMDLRLNSDSSNVCSLCGPDRSRTHWKLCQRGLWICKNSRGVTRCPSQVSSGLLDRYEWQNLSEYPQSKQAEYKTNYLFQKCRCSDLLQQLREVGDVLEYSIFGPTSLIYILRNTLSVTPSVFGGKIWLQKQGLWRLHYKAWSNNVSL